MDEETAGRSVKTQVDQALISRLDEACLDVDYWVEGLKAECGITKCGQLKYLSGSDLEKLHALARFNWEKNAVRELLGIRETHDPKHDPTHTPKQIKVKDEETYVPADDQWSLRDEGKTREDNVEWERMERMREDMQVQEEDWLKSGTHTPIDLTQISNITDDKTREQTTGSNNWSEMKDQSMTTSSSTGWEGSVDALGDQMRAGMMQSNDIPVSCQESARSDELQHLKRRERNDSDPNGDAEKTLTELGLLDFYPSKISLQDVMAVQNRSQKKLTDIPWLILQKLIMLDFKGRESDLRKNIGNEDNAKVKHTDFDDFVEQIAAGGLDDNILNPLDVFVTIYACCDMVLKQILVQKMFLCRLAVPFISPQLSDESLVYSLWAFRNIIIEWKNRDQVCIETSVVSQPVKTVTFLKLGEPSSSKSALLNNVISDQPHHTFWNRECPLGESEHPLANGLVEAQWYLPSGKTEDIFEDVTMFLNLRGDACEHKRQLEVLGNISNAIVCCLMPDDLETPEVQETMKMIHGSHANVVILLEMKELEGQKLKRQLDSYFNSVGISHKQKTKMISTLKGKKERTMEDLKQELRQIIKTQIDGEAQSIEHVSARAMDAGIEIDEEHKHCKKGKELAMEVKSYIETRPTNECKKEMLPLQIHYWTKWSMLLRSHQSAGGKGKKLSTTEELSEIEGEMRLLREDQRRVCNNLSPLMKTFLRNLLKVKDSPAAILYLQWMKIYLDDICRKTLPDLQKQYHQKWRELKASKASPEEMTLDGVEIAKSPSQIPADQRGPKSLSCLRKELAIVEQTLAESSLGVEHLLREVGQIYEAAHETKPESMKDTVQELPAVVAQLLLKGLPMEIMDGDAANVPLTWVEAVFTNLRNIVGVKKLFVISVLGIQSSGKSTLLNTMFGLQFAVSAGRCTRGVYMQLIKVDKESSDLPYDYVLVIDTEGLRAPELGQEKFDNDNQLATFVIGLGDVTILNIKGENMAEISNVLQIAVHAFLRMKLSDNNFQTHRTCYFIHQNVPAVNAKTKMQHGTKVVQEKLDEMTVEACAMENIVDIHSFNQVIKFDSETNVWHISDLWYGDPPMAPINPGYTAKVQEVRDHLLKGPAERAQTFLTFSDMSLHIKDLWKAVLSENFVFSFRNSLAAKAYNSLEKTYHEKSWTVERSVTEWLTQKATVELERSTSKDELEVQYSKLKKGLREQGTELREKACSELEQYIESHNLKEIVIEWKVQKVNSLQHDINRVLETASHKLDDHKENVRLQLLQKVKFAGIDVDIMRKARNYANEMKGKKVDDHQLEQMFNDFWIKSVAELTPRTIGTSIAIHMVVEEVLYRYLDKERAEVRRELRMKPLTDAQSTSLKRGIGITDVEEQHVSMEKSYLGKIKHVLGGKNAMEDCRQKAVEIINCIMQMIDIYLSDISRQDSDFQEMYAANVVKMVVEGVEKHNKDKKGFTLRPQLVVRSAVFACRCALRVFEKIRKEYEDRHSVSKKLDTKRDAAWGLFKNTVRHSKNEVIVADLLSAELEKLVKQSVKKGMALKVENEMLRHFGFQKWNLLIKILGNLAEEPFDKYKSFLSDPKSFGFEWITAFTNKEILNKENKENKENKDNKGSKENKDNKGNKVMLTSVSEESSKYTDFANADVTKFIKDIEDAIKTTTEIVLKQQATKQQPKGQQWVKHFCATLDSLPVSKEDLRYITEYNVQDFENLKELLVERLPTMNKHILSSFKAETAGSIKWEGETPYKHILDKLWGCEARCPFCKEVCQRTDPNHLSPNDCHQCIQHRPEGMGGWSWETDDEKNDKLLIETCNFLVHSDCKFKRDKEWHPYKEYKKHEPDWDIAPSTSMESTKYWMWVMATYKHQLADRYNNKVPDVPEEWDQITKEQALESLRVYQD